MPKNWQERPEGPEPASASPERGKTRAKPAGKGAERVAQAAGRWPGWRAQWYMYNHVTREFVRSMTGRTGVQWTPGLKYARAYKNPAMAQKCASRLNAMLHQPGSSCWPCDSARPKGGLSLQAQEQGGEHGSPVGHRPTADVGNRRLTNAAQIANKTQAKPAAERSDRRGALQPVSVVTGEAARCLDLINKRDGKGNDLFRPDAARRPTFP